MKSVRLTKYARESILQSVMDGFEHNYFKDRVYDSPSKLADASIAAREAAMILLWDKTYGKHAEKLASIPKQLLSGSSFSVATDNGNHHESLNLKGRPGKCTSGVDVLLTQEEWEVVFAERIRLQGEYAEWDKEQKSFRKEVWQILESVNTTAQLVELWPSAEQYLPANLADPEKGIKLPALHISRLNEKLGVAE